jgi:branched-chain amino acid transport system ATP-binding protein
MTGVALKPPHADVLIVERLSKIFGGFRALQGISFQVRRGEILGLIGPNGSGKSTTFNVIAGALKPTTGSIRLDGCEIGGLSADKVCHLGLARTFQIPRPFRNLSLLENVTLAAFFGRKGSLGRAQVEREAAAALEFSGLPTGPTTRTENLGAAGLKKLELARALATRPKVLLVDEYLSGLDITEMNQAAETLMRVRNELGVTIVWVEHIMGVLMRVVDRVIVLDHGDKICEGAMAQVVQDPRIIEMYLGKGRA